MDLPIKVEGVLFAIKDGEHSFLILKRTPEEGGFWQPLTGTVEDGERIQECLLRELKEETGIENPVKVTEKIWSFDWRNKHDEAIVEFVYGIELNPESEVTISPAEHSEYKWCSFDEAVELLGRDNNKKAFVQFKEKVMDTAS